VTICDNAEFRLPESPRIFGGAQPKSLWHRAFSILACEQPEKVCAPFIRRRPVARVLEATERAGAYNPTRIVGTCALPPSQTWV